MKTFPSDDPSLFPTGDLANNFSPNPMVRRHGRGPEGTHCKTCRYLQSQSFGTARHYWKCTRYSVSHSEASDFRLKWESCRLYERESV